MLTATESLTAWQQVWREGIAPLLSTDGLAALEAALAGDDADLIQGWLCIPRPIPANYGMTVLAADLIGYALWMGADIATVGELEEAYYRVINEADANLNEPAATRRWFEFADGEPREKVHAALLPEVRRVLKHRRGG